MSQSNRPSGAPTVRVLPSADAATAVLLGELRAAAESRERALVSFATGGTYTAMLQALHHELARGTLSLQRCFATHLDEYFGYRPDQHGGMVHELCTACPSLDAMLRSGRFLPVPGEGTAARLREHEQRLQQLGGVQLQLLGIGRNGHLAFNEPGTPWELGFHVTELAATTREDARARFAPAEVPTRAVTAGIASIVAAKRLVLCAFGSKKAAAVRAMLEGEPGPQCPASVVRQHGNVLVLLDPPAASELRGHAATQ